MKKELSFLVATMNQDNRDLIKRMNIKDSYVVVNQNKVIDEGVTIEDNKIWLNSKDKGLSKSRNLATRTCKTKYALICDDDMVYNNDVQSEVSKYFEKNENVDILVFQVRKEFSKYKNYFKNETRVNRITAMKVSSVEIAFKTKSIRDKNIYFDELFGAGAKYSMGEENIFLNDCLLHGLRIKYIPFELGYLTEDRESSWFKGFSEKYFIDQGAVYGRLGRYLSFLLILQFLIRKRAFYREGNIHIQRTLSLMLKGRKEILRSKKNV